MSVRAVLLVSLAMGGVPANVMAQVAAQPRHLAPPVTTVKAAAVAGLVLFATAIGDEGLREEFQEHRNGETNSLAQVGNVLGEPLVVFPAIGAGYLAGRIAGSSTLSRVSMRAGTAAFLASGITGVLKYSIGRTRPTRGGDSDQFRPFSGSASFPSGHTTLAFAVATVIADETHDRWSDVALYGAASVTAFARINDDRHWASDVLAGALIGHLTARWLDRRQGLLTIRPGSVGVSLAF